MYSDFVKMPNVVEMEKALLSALMLKEGRAIPAVAAIIGTEDFYRAEHRLVFDSIMRLHSQGIVSDVLAVIEDLKKRNELNLVGHVYLLSLIDATFTDARAEYHARIIKEKSELRKIIDVAMVILDNAQNDMFSPKEVVAYAQHFFNDIGSFISADKSATFGNFFYKIFRMQVADMRNYATRSTGFENIDRNQFFSPGFYVIGATPAAGKSTFCWQLLEQMARRGEKCIYCSYEMSQLELFSKSLSREMFKRAPFTDLTAAGIRRGDWSVELDYIVEDFSKEIFSLSVFELQDESIDDLLALLRPLCSDKKKAPVVCLDYLQIVPTSKESTRLGIDDTVRKLKKFQRDTNTTFIVISSFNRTNYTHAVSFESFKESGNIEYTADVVWALQLNVLNSLNPCNISAARKKIEEAKKRQPRQIHLKCLKNRQGNNYDCFFNYYSAHDYFEPRDCFDNN